MSDKEEENDSAKCPVPGELVDEQDTVSYAKRFVEFKCGFKDRAGKPACDWTTNLMSRKAANQLLGEHWTIHHENDFQQIQKEKEVAREAYYQDQMERLKQSEQEAEIAREHELFKLRATNAAKLKRIQAGIATPEDLNGINNEDLILENEDNKTGALGQQPGNEQQPGNVDNLLVSEFTLAMREQTQMFRIVTDELRTNKGDQQTNEAIKSIASMSERQLKTKAVLTKEPKCPKLAKDEKWESYWKQFDRYEKDLIQYRPGLS